MRRRSRGARAPQRPQFLSEADCHDIAQRLARFAKGGGYTTATIVSTWAGNVRWARNLVSTSGDVRDDHILVTRNIDGSVNSWVEINDDSDAALVAATRRAERMAQLNPAVSNFDVITKYEPEPYTAPPLFSEATYQLSAGARAEAARQLAKSAADAGLLSAGYIQISAHSQALITSYGYARYFQYTWAQYSVTVRDPKGTGSGWAGVDWPEWSKIDAPKLSEVAMEKCLQSRNPVAIEPGRYTTILEPQAVNDFIGKLFIGSWWQGVRYQAWDRLKSENNPALPFFKKGTTKIGERVMDERITITSDPLDPDLGFPPFRGVENLELAGEPWGEFYHPVTWVDKGVLTSLAYDREYGFHRNSNLGLPKQGAFKMSGGDTSIAEMIATTKRGLLVTRFDDVQTMNDAGRASLMCNGYTRDGLWLIENGKISKAVKNLRFIESVLFALNNVEQLGVPQRVFHPTGDFWWDAPRPAVVPSMKIRDFSFTALSNAI